MHVTDAFAVFDILEWIVLAYMYVAKIKTLANKRWATVLTILLLFESLLTIFFFAIKGTRDNFKIHVNFMKPTFLCSLRQDKAYDKK